MPRLYLTDEKTAIKKLRRIAEIFEQAANELEANEWKLRSDTIDGGIAQVRDQIDYFDFDAPLVIPPYDTVDIEISGRQKWGRK